MQKKDSPTKELSEKNVFNANKLRVLQTPTRQGRQGRNLMAERVVAPKYPWLLC